MYKHEVLMRRAYSLARKAMAEGNHPFSAMLVIDGEVVLECLNTVNTAADATRHPELDILRLAAEKRMAKDLARATVYASTEPCAMCSGAIYWSGIATLVYGCPAETLGEIAGGSLVVPSRSLFARGKRKIEVIGPVLAEEGAEIHRGFW
jgi:tRNA(Arg) A34 adenosine deaminase TadA